MQQLEERNTYTPTDIPHIRSNCGLILNRTETSVHAVSTYGAAIRVCDVNWRNGLEETLSVSGLKTSFNNSDAALIATEHAKQNTSVSAVYVLNIAREYVLHRDNHTCQACKGKSKDPILETHHIISRQVGGDSPDNLLQYLRRKMSILIAHSFTNSVLDNNRCG